MAAWGVSGLSPASEEESFATSSSSAYAPIVLKIAEIAQNLRFFLISRGALESLPIPKTQN